MQTDGIFSSSYKTDTVSRNIKPGHEESVILHLKHTHGWYDFTVKAQDAGGAEARYAGRVETGKSSFSDPLMGFVLL